VAAVKPSAEAPGELARSIDLFATTLNEAADGRGSSGRGVPRGGLPR
jgi:hypothetical protein